MPLFHIALPLNMDQEGTVSGARGFPNADLVDHVGVDSRVSMEEQVGDVGVGGEHKRSEVF
jgi:hypothetical protein